MASVGEADAVKRVTPSHARAGKPLLIACIGILVLALVLGVVTHHSREPSCQGKRLSQWLEELDYRTRQSQEKREEATVAIRQMGTNAVPFLLQYLHRQDLWITAQLKNWLSRQPFIRIQWTPSQIWHRRAIEACRLLGPLANETIPVLVQDLETREMGIAASLALAYIGPEAVPALTNVLATGSDLARTHTLRGMPHFFTNRSECIIPALKACLQDTNVIIRREAVAAMRYVGFASEPVVVPLLLSCVQDPDSTVRYNAMLSLTSCRWPEAWTFYTEALQHPDMSVRGMAANRLVILDFERARQIPGVVAALAENIQNTNQDVARSCAGHLKLIQSQAAAQAGIK